MQISIEHRPSYALGIVNLAAGEEVRAETGAMVSMTSNVEVVSGLQGGLLQSAMRKVLGGESFFLNTFKASGAPGQVTVAPSLPGDITDVDVRGNLYVQSGSFLAGEAGVDVDIKLKLLPGMVWAQLPSLPTGASGPNHTVTLPSLFATRPSFFESIPPDF